MGKGHMQKLVIYSVGSLIMLCLLNSGCFDSLVSDWEYEHYYYIDIQGESKNNLTVIVPLPYASSLHTINTEQIYIDNYMDNLKIEKGYCTYEIIEYKSNNYLRIKGYSPISISSSFRLSDSCADISIETKEFNRTMIFSDSSNISLVVDSRAVRKTNEKDTWDLYYSVAINSDIDFPIPTKNTWKKHLSDEYFFTPQLGWHSYSLQEDTNWNNRLIR